jgi:hypothetical protein
MAPFRTAAFAAPFALLLACPGKEDDTGSGDTAPPIEDGTLVDANNYNFTGALDVPSITTASAVDITIDWSAVTSDIQCHEVDPAVDIDLVGLVRFPNFTQEDVEAGLSNNNLDQNQMNGYVQIQNDAELTTGQLADMSFFGTVIDVPAQYFDGGGTYLMMLNSGITPGVGVRMLSFLAPSGGSDNTVAAVGSGCGLLDFDVDLQSLTRAKLPTAGPWALDWGDLTVDGQGNPFDSSGIDSVMLGFYAGVTVADLEAGFLDIEQSATEVYILPLEGGTTGDLAGAMDPGGVAFSGFHDGGEWILALRCSRCYNPAPPFLTLVTPE